MSEAAYLVAVLFAVSLMGLVADVLDAYWPEEADAAPLEGKRGAGRYEPHPSMEEHA